MIEVVMDKRRQTNVYPRNKTKQDKLHLNISTEVNGYKKLPQKKKGLADEAWDRVWEQTDFRSHGSQKGLLCVCLTSGL